MTSPSPTTAKHWYPPSSLAEFLLLCILVGLVLAIWLQAKRDLSGPKEPVLLTMHESIPRAAIYGESGLRVVDCVTGKTLLKSPAIQYYKMTPPSDDSPWHVWPRSNANFTNPLWSFQRIPAIRVAGFQTSIEPESPEDYAADGFQLDLAEEKTLQLPADRNNPFHEGRPLRFLFSPDGATLVLRVRKSNDKFEYQVFDLHARRRTIYQNAANPSGLSPRMATFGARVVFADGGRKIDKIIDPPFGFVDAAKFPEALEALNESPYEAPRFPIRGVDDQGRKVLITMVAREGAWLVVEPDLEDKELTDLKSATTIWKWPEEPNRRWQADNRLVLWTPLAGAPPTASTVWIVDDRPPFIRHTPWPFSEQEIISQLTMEVDVRGMTAWRVRRNDPASKENPESIYWDFENARVAKIPDGAERTRRYGDVIVSQTDEFLQTIDLNSGRVLQTISLKQGIRPPLTLAWSIWLITWCVAKRKTIPNDLTRQVGAVSAIFFAILIALSYYYSSPYFAWLLNLLLITSLLISLIVISATRRASVISLAICGLLTLGFLFSALQRGFANHPDDVFGPNTSEAMTLKEIVSRNGLGSTKETVDSILAPWTTPKKITLPAPDVTLNPP